MSELGVDRLMAWARSAQPGEDVIYATGDRPSEPVRGAVRALARAGVVAPVQVRRETGFAFIAQRTAAPIERLAAPRRSPSRGVARAPAGMAGRASERALYRLLVRRASTGLACPTDSALAAMLGLPGRLSASYRLRRLVAAGLIAIEHPHPWGPRIVTICATGKRTKG